MFYFRIKQDLKRGVFLIICVTKGKLYAVINVTLLNKNPPLNTIAAI